VVQKVYNESSEISSKVVKADGLKIEIGRYFAKMNLELYPSMTGAKYTLNGNQGTPPGRGITTQPYFVGCIPFAYSHTLSAEDMADGTKAVMVGAGKTVSTRTFGEAAQRAKVWEDITLHTDGSGILTNGASSVTTVNILYRGTTKAVTAYTFGDVSDFRKADILVQGMSVECFDSTFTNRRAVTNLFISPQGNVTTAAPIGIHAINYATGQVTLTETVVSAAVGDVLAIPGLIAPSVTGGAGYSSGYSGGATPPLSSFNQTSPTGGAPSFYAYQNPDPFAGTYFNQQGITGDAFRHGLFYALDTNPGNFFFQVAKSSVPELIPANYNAAGAPLSYFMLMIVMEQLQQRRDNDAFESLIGLAHMVQFRAWHDAGLAVTTHYSDGATYGKTWDPTPDQRNQAGSFNMNGIMTYKDKRMRRDTILLVNPKNIGKAVQQPLKPFDLDGTKGVHYRYDIGTGTPMATIDFVMTDSWDFAWRDPGASGVISGLALPIGS
jgi:hypothetical protein